MGKLDEQRRITYLTSVYRQINDMIQTESKGSRLIDHSLEEGLSNEEIVRKTLRRILPKRYGIGKGKVVNKSGSISKHCDVIIFDAFKCPNLFLDDHMNQVLPFEGVYAIIEIKTTLTKSKIKESFDQVDSVKSLSNEIIDVSTNDLVQIIPPLASVIAFNDKRSLETIYDNYVALSKEYERAFSSLSYSKKSPGYQECTDQHFLIENIVIIDKGIVHYMYHGVPCFIASGVDSLGFFIVGLFQHLQEMTLQGLSLYDYYGTTSIEYDQITKGKEGLSVVKPGRRKLLSLRQCRRDNTRKKRRHIGRLN